MTNPNAFIERLLQDAGISSGMKVLDIGCGNGEVTLLISRIVGEKGQVLGVDMNSQAIAKARERAEVSEFNNMTFVEGQIPEIINTLGQFDAAVGRRILMYLKNPVETLNCIVEHLKPGGLVVFQESDSTEMPMRLATLPLHDKVMAWIWKTVEREGANMHIGFDLPAFFKKAGISMDHIRAEPIIQGQGMNYPLALIVRVMLSRIVATGVANEEEIGIETLEDRLSEERQDEPVYISDMAFGIWGHALN